MYRPLKYTEQKLAEFEQAWGIVLPAPYRNYLKEVGGGAGTRSAVDLLEDWSYHPEDLPADFLQRQFPHSGPWNDRSLHSDAGWRAPYFSDDLVCGSIRIRSTGCEGHDILIISGPLRGGVWHDDRACCGTGILPLTDDQNRRVEIGRYLKLGRKDAGLARKIQS
ncbi:SMI1/KNR4 family protein [Haloferula chungangensis]|uniref:SMI1/KNR4 family protein n=1 Tax=Haloferula chungangensis TaxID=1048331 RepID=A0ABW2LB91_9BACT